MTVLSSTFNLSDNAKYLNFKVDTTDATTGVVRSTASLQDKKDLMHVIQRAISTEIDDTASNPISNHLGWERFDGADSAGDIVHGGDDSATFGFLRAKCYDHATTGHYKYLKLKLFERDEATYLENNEYNDEARSNRYLSSNKTLVLRYEMFGDWPASLLTSMLAGSTTQGGWTKDSAIAAGSSMAEADGFGKMDGSLAYEAQSWYWNAGRFGNNPGSGNTATSVFTRMYNNNNTNSFNNALGNLGNIIRKDGTRGNSTLYDIYYDRYAQTGFGHKDTSVKNMYNELKFLIDGNSTLWMFGDQASSAANVDSAHGTDTYRGVDSNADARYLIMHTTQHQDDDPEKVSEYNTTLFASEYKKEYGEAAPDGEYIHNGLRTNLHSLLMNNGMATPNSFYAVDPILNNDTSLNNNVSNSVVLANSKTSTETSGNVRYQPAVGANNYVYNSHRYFGTYVDGNPTNANSNGAVGEQRTGPTRNHVLAGSNIGYGGNYFTDTSQNSTAEKTTNQDTANGNNRANAVTAEAGGNILMGFVNRYFNVNDTVWGDDFTNSQTVGLLQNSSLSNQRDKNLGVGETATGNKNAKYGSLTYQDWDLTTATNGSNVVAHGAVHGRENMWLGADGAQFALTEYPTRTSSTLRGTINRSESVQTYDGYITPASGREYLSATRLHMGWLGYVGHQNKHTCFSLNELFFGSRHGLFGDDDAAVLGSLSEHTPGDPGAPGRVATYGASIPMVSAYVDSASGNAIDTADANREAWQEFHPTPENLNQYSVYEPIISVGTMRLHGGGLHQHEAPAATIQDAGTGYTYVNNQNVYAQSTNHHFYGEFGNPGGTSKKQSAFAMLGRTYGLKIFGPYSPHKYNYLDQVSIQLDDDGFYAVNPSNSVAHWVLPMNCTQAAILIKK